LASWLDFPQCTSITCFQGHFATILLDITHSADILLLDCIWNAYMHPKQCIVNCQSMRNITDTDIEEFTQALIQLMPLVVDPSLNMEDNAMLKKVQSNLDFYLPFRNLAPSCAHVIAHGPFDPAYMLTRSRLFSAIIFHGITFASPSIFDDHQNQFANVKDWELYYSTHKVDDEHGILHFCNMHAYGTPNMHHGPPHIPKYWAGCAEWETMVQNHDVEFTKVWEFLTHQIYGYIGKLCAFLLASDISYTGVISMATPMEVGWLIRQIKKGSYKQMVKMELISEECSEEECGIAYETLYHTLDHILWEDKKKDIGFDVYLPEYALCKMARLTKKSRTKVPGMQME
ncbi:hypothetical protein K439DRAFT_1365987, partial [Ramaria rubella]